MKKPKIGIKNEALSKLPIMLIILAACELFLESCGLLCVDANLSPQALIEANDYVITGQLVSVDTLADLGSLSYLGSEKKAYIIEYAFKPEEIFKGDAGTPFIYLWCCITVRLRDGYYNSPECDLQTQLIYGREIRELDSLIQIYTPNLVWAGDIPVLRDWVNGKTPESLWAAATGDSTLIARIIKSTYLDSVLRDRNENGRVIYATEKGYYTHHSFCRSDLVYCNHLWGLPQFVSPSTYVKKLRSLSR